MRPARAADHSLRAGRLEGSGDGSTWTGAATITGTGRLAELTPPRTTAWFLRIVSTGSASSWWSVSDVRLHR